MQAQPCGREIGDCTRLRADEGGASRVRGAGIRRPLELLAPAAARAASGVDSHVKFDLRGLHQMSHPAD